MTETKTQDRDRAQALAIPMAGGMLMPSNFQEGLQFAGLLAKSGLVPKQYEGNTGAVLVAMQMGAELGLSPMAAIQSVAVINGRPSLWGDAVLAVCLSHPDCEDVIEVMSDDKTVAQCTVKRRGRSPIVRSFSVEDAKRAGLHGKQGPWSQYPHRMLQLRARAFALRDAFPDALRGIRVAEEERDITIDAGVYDAPIAPPPSAPLTEPGIHKVGKAKERADKRAAAAKEAQTQAQPEPSHDPQTGEVVQATPQPELGW